MSPRAAASLTLASVVVLYAAFRLAGQYGSPSLSSPVGEGLLKLAVWALPSVLVVGLAWRLSPRGTLVEIGLWGNPIAGYLFGLAAGWPLLLWTDRGVSHVVMAIVLGNVVLGPFAEEVLFRGLLFRQLYRRAARRPLRAMLVSAIAFGGAHLANVDLTNVLRYPAIGRDAIGMVGMATIGGILLAWVAYRWDSLWPAIGLHTILNLSWELTSAGHPAGLVTETRVASVAAAVGLTLWFTRSRVRATAGDVSRASI